MNKSDKYLSMSCYRYAPESFQAFRVTGFKNGNRNIPIYDEIKLSFDERQELGNLRIGKGKDEALARLKHILRERVGKTEQRYKMGFFIRFSNREFVHLHGGLTFKQYDLAGMYKSYLELKHAMDKDCWKIQTSKSVKLDGYYRPIRETETEGFTFVDPERPVKLKIKFE